MLVEANKFLGNRIIVSTKRFLVAHSRIRAFSPTDHNTEGETNVMQHPSGEVLSTNREIATSSISSGLFERTKEDGSFI